MNKRRKHMLEVIPVMVLLMLGIFFVVQSVIESSENSDRLIMLNTGWTVNGEAVDALPDRVDCEAGETTVFSRPLDESFTGQCSICFYTVYETAKVTLDGETIYSYEHTNAEMLTRAVPSCWNTVLLPEGCGGKTLTIEVSCPYTNYANLIPEVRMGTAGDVEHFVRMQSMPLLIVAITVLVIGLITSLTAVVLRYYLIGSSGLYSFSLFIVVLAVFLVMQQTTMLFSFSRRIPYILIQHISFMLCPVMYTRYLMRNGKGVSRKIAIVLNAVSILNLAVITVLQLLRVRDFPEMISSTRNLCVLIAVYVFFMELRQHKKILAAGFACIVGYAIFVYYFTGEVSWIIYIVMFAYLGTMVYRLMITLLQSKGKEIRLESALDVSRSEIATIQITSHFFYHTLDSIRALIRIDADKAYKMTGDFAKYIRYRVDGVERLQETVPFSRELRSIRAYTDIKSAQLGDRLHMEFDIETEDFEILPLTVQPLVENAVIHAVQRRREGGIIRLVCRETPKGYHIEVIDNGPGENAVPETPKQDNRASTAIKNVNTRLEFYGIAPLEFRKNEMGGTTVSLDNPKHIETKEKKNESNIGG